MSKLTMTRPFLFLMFFHKEILVQQSLMRSPKTISLSAPVLKYPSCKFLHASPSEPIHMHTRFQGFNGFKQWSCLGTVNPLKSNSISKFSFTQRCFWKLFSCYLNFSYMFSQFFDWCPKDMWCIIGALCMYKLMSWSDHLNNCPTPL